MLIELTHPFVFRCLDSVALMKDCFKFNTFLSRVEKQSELPTCKDANKYKGDALELFTEALIKLSPTDMRIGIANYQVVPENDDTGVDGTGIGNNLQPATVQVKYRPSDYILEANTDHLANFTSSSVLKYGVKAEDKNNMLIITSAANLHHYTDNEMFKNKVRVLNRENLRTLVDDNVLFWNSFRLSWEEARSDNK